MRELYHLKKVEQPIMTSSHINQGDLLAHLDGKRQPHLDVALRNQPELRTELEALREADKFLQQKFGRLRILRPDSQDLVDVVTGQASAAQELRVMAYVRQSPAGDAEMAALREAFADAEAEEQGFRESKGFFEPITRTLRQFLALPLQAAGVRGTSPLYSQESENTFYVAELDARVTIYTSPSIGEEWIIEGYLTQREAPINGVRATLEQNEEIIASTESEDGGFLTFEAIEAGSYQIKIHLEQGILITPQIELKDE